MTITTFIAGTKAKASEVNNNFEETQGGGPLTIPVFTPDSVGAGTWAITVNTSSIYNGHLYNSASKATDLDNISWKAFIPPGTYTMKVIYSKNTDAGVLDIDMDATELTSIDAYNGGGLTFNNVDTTASIVVADGGIKTIKARVDGKNAGSSAYAAYIVGIIFYRTA